MKLPHDSRPKGTAGLGKFGEAVSLDFVEAYGSRAQRRMAARILRKQQSKPPTPGRRRPR